MKSQVNDSTARGANQPLLQVRGLSVRFETRGGAVRAVDDVTFDINPGSSTGVVGESGSGKSVTSLAIMGLIEEPGEVVGGSILFKGQDLAQLPEAQFQKLRGKDIALVFQEPMTALNPVYTVGAQVVEAIQAHQPLTKKQAMHRAIELFTLVGIPGPEVRVHDYPHKLSGGMRQRVTIAMALANEPDLLILDEPTTALDTTIQAQILDLVKELRTRINTAVLLITHDIGVVVEVCDDVVVMYCGRVMEQGSTQQIIDEPLHPYTIGLLDSRPTTAQKGQPLKTIGGAVPNPLEMPPGCPFATRCARVMEICSTTPPLVELPDGRSIACWLHTADSDIAPAHKESA